MAPTWHKLLSKGGVINVIWHFDFRGPRGTTNMLIPPGQNWSHQTKSVRNIAGVARRSHYKISGSENK